MAVNSMFIADIDTREGAVLICHNEIKVNLSAMGKTEGADHV
jgi:hypothetical protein